MKKSHCIILVTLFILFGCKKPKPEIKTMNQTDSVSIKSEVSTASVLETIVSDLNSDGKVDSCFIMIPPKDGEPGEFREIFIKLNGGIKTRIVSEDFWNPVDSSFLAVNRQNAVNSKRVYAYKDRNKTFILLFGYHFGTGRRFQISEIDGLKIRTIFDKEFDDIEFFGKEKEGNQIALIVRNSPELYSTIDSLNADVGTYSPYLVYKYNGSLVLDESASRDYNLKNYLWKGIKYDGDQKVLYPRSDEKPKFID
jgi:hypothetical protein